MACFLNVFERAERVLVEGDYIYVDYRRGWNLYRWDELNDPDERRSDRYCLDCEHYQLDIEPGEYGGEALSVTPFCDHPDIVEYMQGNDSCASNHAFYLWNEDGRCLVPELCHFKKSLVPRPVTKCPRCGSADIHLWERDDRHWNETTRRRETCFLFLCFDCGSWDKLVAGR